MIVLEIVIGLVFAYLLFSLLGTIVQEFIATLLSLRGKVLLEALVKMMEQEKYRDRWLKLIRNSKVYNKYVEHDLFVRQLPAYLSSDQVISILQEILAEAEPVSDGGGASQARGMNLESSGAPVEQIKDNDLRRSLSVLQRAQAAPPTARGGERGIGPDDFNLQVEIEAAKRALARNFDEMMDRASGWYKRRVQALLVFIGLVIAVVFNADTLAMYRSLAENPGNREEILAVAGNFVAEDRYEVYVPPRDTLLPPPEPSTEELMLTRARLDTLLARELTEARSPLGLGWDQIPAVLPEGVSPVWWWSKKAFGWIVTALAISLGSAFWFDLLKLLMNIRNAGNPPREEERQRG
jgi:hypothetical protein